MGHPLPNDPSDHPYFKGGCHTASSSSPVEREGRDASSQAHSTHIREQGQPVGKSPCHCWVFTRCGSPHYGTTAQGETVPGKTASGCFHLNSVLMSCTPLLLSFPWAGSYLNTPPTRPCMTQRTMGVSVCLLSGCHQCQESCPGALTRLPADGATVWARGLSLLARGSWCLPLGQLCK